MAKSKFCTNCGAPASSGRFCRSCGSTLEMPRAGQVEPRHATTVAEATGQRQPEPSGTAGATVVVEEQAHTAVEPTVDPGTKAEPVPDSGASSSTGADGGDMRSPAAPFSSPPGPASEPVPTPSPAASEPVSTPGAPATDPDPAPGGPTGPMPAASQRPRWLPIALSVGTVLVLFAIVAAVLIAVGNDNKSTSKAGTRAVTLPASLIASRADFLRAAGVPYFAMLPAGWSAISVRPLPGVASALTVKSPIDEGAVVTVGEVQHPPATLASEGAALIKADAAKPGFRQGSVASTKLRDGTPAWVGSYNLGNLTTVDYVVRSCNSMFVVAANLAPAQVSLLGDKIETVASVVHKGC
jgi:hypothetical protein